MSFFKSNKCKICKVRRQQRFCLRQGKDICWECCNNIRIDRKCPSPCSYALKEDSAFNVKTKVDSTSEYRDLVRKLFDRWAMLPHEEFGNAIPLELAKTTEGKEILTNYIKKYDLSRFPEVEHIIRKLKLSGIEYPEMPELFEEIAIKAMQLLLLKDHESVLDLYFYKAELIENEDFKEDFYISLKNDRVLKRIKEFKLVSAAQSKDQEEALVFFDVNGRYDLTLRLKLFDGKWLFWQRIMGKMELVNGEHEACQQVGVLITQNQLGKAYELLEKYISIYPDSSNINYLKGVYEKLHKREDKAKQFFLRGVRLDPEFTETRVNYSSQLFLEGNKEKALAQLLIADKLNKDVKIKNNIAVIYLELKEYKQAEKFLKDCLRMKSDYEPALLNMKRLEDISAER